MNAPLHRGTFHDRYLIPADIRDRRNPFPRLLECVLCLAQSDDPEYFQACEIGEFAVVDTKTGEKAWCEIPDGTSTANITAIVESHFAVKAHQVDQSLWVV